MPARAPYKISTQSFSLPTALLDEVRSVAKATGSSASALVRDALEAHLIDLRLDEEAEALMRRSPGGARRELVEVAGQTLNHRHALGRDDPYRVGSAVLHFVRPVSERMFGHLGEAFGRAVAAAWVEEDRWLRHRPDRAEPS